MNIGEDTYGIATIDVTRDIITTINIVDITCQHSDTSCIASGNFTRIIIGIQLDVSISDRSAISIKRTHIRLATTAIDVINLHSLAFDLQEQTLWSGHTSLIATTIEVADLTFLQIPSRTDGHISLVITAKQTSYLESITAGIRESGIDTHLVLKAIVSQQFTNRKVFIEVFTFFVCIGIGSINDTTHYCTGVVQTDDGLFSYCRIVTTTISIDDGTTMNVKECLANIWWSKLMATGSHFHAIHYSIIDCGGTFIFFIFFPFTIFILAIATAKELTNIDRLGTFSLSSNSIFTFFSYGLGGNEHQGIPSLVNVIFRVSSMRRHNFWQFIIRRANSSGNIVTTIKTVYDDIVRGMGTINVHKSPATDICHTSTSKDPIKVASMHSNSGITAGITGITTTIDMTANSNLRLQRSCSEEHHQAYYDIFYSQPFILTL